LPNPNISFEGETLYLPGAYYSDNVSASLSPAQITTPPLIFIGFGYGQKPQSAMTYTSTNDLLAAIRGGPCSGFVPFLTSPSTELNGAQLVTFIEAGLNTQSALTLYSGVSGVINLQSADYGLPSNLLQTSISAASISGRLVTLYDGYGNTTRQGDNLGIPLQFSYLGSSSGVTYSVLGSGGVATNFVISSPTSGQSINIALNAANYPTVEQVVEYLNGTGWYTANVLSATNGQLASSSLDLITSGAVASGTTISVSATLADIVYWYNQFAEDINGNPLVIAAIASAITSSPALAPSILALTPFSGATSVPPTLSAYASGFNLALSLPGWAVFADSNSSGVVALGTQHALTASEIVNGKWRRFFSGSSLGDTTADAIAAAIGQNSIRTVYAYPGINVVNTTTGLATLYGGLYAAAAAAGMATGNPPNIALTNKSLTGIGVEFTLTGSQLNELQQAGVMPIYIPDNTPGVPTIASDMTTWQEDSNPENIFLQQVQCRDFLAYTMVNALQPYVGSTPSPNTETKLLNAAKKALNASIYRDSGNGVISSWDPDTLVLVYDGLTQTAAISVNVVLVGQNRFITIYVPILPLNFTITSNQNGLVAAA
jgi:hypothetical protein